MKIYFDRQHHSSLDTTLNANLLTEVLGEQQIGYVYFMNLIVLPWITLYFVPQSE